jgi:hypothetical protein
MTTPTIPPARQSNSPFADSLDVIAQELDDIRDIAANGQQALILAQQKHMAESRAAHQQTQEMIVDLLRRVEQLGETDENTADRLKALERGQNGNVTTK